MTKFRCPVCKMAVYSDSATPPPHCPARTGTGPCTLCREVMPDRNKYGECVECVDAAKATWGF